MDLLSFNKTEYAGITQHLWREEGRVKFQINGLLSELKDIKTIS